MKPDLSHRPKLLRSTIARGLAASSKAVDEKGGDFGAGIIRGMAVITRGEALGHYLWCDRTMLAQVADAINAGERGTKARFTHPDLSGDGLGKGLGRVKDARLDNDTVRADLHFFASAHESPEGDLAGYVMRLAKEDPAAFGNSIAFDPDYLAEDKFRSQHSEADDDGYPRFQTPDADNKKNLPHARVADLRAVDTVDDPAANPSGLFHRGQEIALDAEKLLTWSLGLSSERPQLVSLDLDPDRAAGFISRFLARNNLTLSTKDGAPLHTDKFAAGLAQQFAAPADKEDKKKQTEKAAQEEGDADKDEGQDKDKDESAGAEKKTSSKVRSTKLAEKCMDDQEEKKKKELDDEESDDEEEMSKRLAVGGEAPKGDAPGDEASRQKQYEEDEKKKNEKGKTSAEKDTPVGSPGDDKSAIGPMGDPSTNVGYSAARADAKKFVTAFGAQGGVWFAEGKSFEQAQQLHIGSIRSENEKLKSENAELQKKLGAKRGLETALSGGFSKAPDTDNKPSEKARGEALTKFTAGITAELVNRGNLN